MAVMAFFFLSTGPALSLWIIFMRAGAVALDNLHGDILQRDELRLLQHGAKAARNLDEDVDGRAVGALCDACCVDSPPAKQNPRQ